MTNIIMARHHTPNKYGHVSHKGILGQTDWLIQLQSDLDLDTVTTVETKWLPPWSRVHLEAKNHTTSQEIHCLLCNPKVYYHVHRSLPLVPTWIPLNLVHTFSPHFSMILLPMLKSSKWSLPFRFSNQNFVCIPHLSHVCCMTHPPHFP